MTYLLVHHTTESYAKWKEVYDEHLSTRKAGGSLGARLLRNINNGDEVVIITSWPDTEHALAFASSPDLRATMERAGVVGAPEVIFLEEVETTEA